MYLLLVLLWILFNGRFTWEILIFGLVISAVLYWFCCQFLGYSVKKELAFFRKIGLVIELIVTLLVEIFKANGQVILWIYSSKYRMEPALVHFKTDLKSETARAVLADCITLTPGTITATLEGDEYTVHCLDRDMGEGLDESAFVKILRKLEAKNHDNT